MLEVHTLQAVFMEVLNWNRARINFLANFIMALIKVKNVNLVEIATAFILGAWTISVEEAGDGYRVEVSSPYGHGLDASINGWLATDQDAASLLAPKEPTHDGELTRAVRRLRGMH